MTLLSAGSERNLGYPAYTGRKQRKVDWSRSGRIRSKRVYRWEILARYHSIIRLRGVCTWVYWGQGKNFGTDEYQWDDSVELHTPL